MLNENKQLDAKIQKARELQRQTEALMKDIKRTAIKEIHQYMPRYNITLEELGATAASKTKAAAPAADQQPKKAVKRVKVSPKYQSEDGLQTWTGRGLKPKWLKAELDAGRKLEDFLIKTE